MIKMIDGFIYSNTRMHWKTKEKFVREWKMTEKKWVYDKEFYEKLTKTYPEDKFQYIWEENGVAKTDIITPVDDSEAKSSDQQVQPLPPQQQPASWMDTLAQAMWMMMQTQTQMVEAQKQTNETLKRIADANQSPIWFAEAEKNLTRDILDKPLKYKAVRYVRYVTRTAMDWSKQRDTDRSNKFATKDEAIAFAQKERVGNQEFKVYPEEIQVES